MDTQRERVCIHWQNKASKQRTHLFTWLVIDFFKVLANDIVILSSNQVIFTNQTILYCLPSGDVYVPVLWQAPFIDSNDVFPVIVFTHGLGGNRTTYSTLCSDIASHGYIVAVLEHRYHSRVVEIPTCERKEMYRSSCLLTYFTPPIFQYLARQW